MKSWQMRSGEAHCDEKLADEIRRGGGRRRKEEAEEGRGGTHLTENLTTLTWQVGNKRIDIVRITFFFDLKPPVTVVFGAGVAGNR